MWKTPALAILAVAILGSAAALAQARPEPAVAAPAPVRWEYRQEPFHGDYDRLRTLLDTAGADGYELVLLSPQETVAIFKRPVAP